MEFHNVIVIHHHPLVNGLVLFDLCQRNLNFIFQTQYDSAAEQTLTRDGAFTTAEHDRVHGRRTMSLNELLSEDNATHPEEHLEAFTFTELSKVRFMLW